MKTARVGGDVVTEVDRVYEDNVTEYIISLLPYVPRDALKVASRVLYKYICVIYFYTVYLVRALLRVSRFEGVQLSFVNTRHLKSFQARSLISLVSVFYPFLSNNPLQSVFDSLKGTCNKYIKMFHAIKITDEIRKYKCLVYRL